MKIFDANFTAKPVKSKDPVVTKIVSMSPSKATELLSRNDGNRQLNNKIVTRYAADMRQGKWVFDGSPIRISSTGNVLDGQHRLYAVIESGATIQVLIIYGLEDEVFPYIDTGKKRSPFDTMYIRGYSNPRIVGAVARAVFLSHGFSNKWNGMFTEAGGHFVTNHVLDEVVNEYPEILETCVRFDGKEFKKIKRWVPETTAVFVYLWLSRIDKEDAELFFDALETGTGLSASDPEYVLRERLSILQPDYSIRGKRELISLFFKAWNARRIGKTIRLLRFNQNEKFPIPV